MALCKRCDSVKLDTKFWYEEFIKDSDTGKGRFVSHEICTPCDNELVARLKATIMGIVPKALRQGMLAKL